jgi:NADPH:quinone reductase-like Zn-dependent oxidoreductase
MAMYPRGFRSITFLPILKDLSYEETVTVSCGAVTVWNVLFERKPLAEYPTAPALGSGDVPALGAQPTKAASARAVATTPSNEKDKCKALGMNHAINYRENPEWSETIKELTGGVGVERV